jgi:hypothetical protein
MASNLDGKFAGRVPGSLLPQLFDTIEYTYPDDVTVVEVYSYGSTDGEGDSYITGIIEKKYTDATKSRLERMRRIPCG